MEPHAPAGPSSSAATGAPAPDWPSHTSTAVAARPTDAGRRSFLRGLGGLAMAGAAGALAAPPPSYAAAVGPQSPEQRARQALQVRVQAAAREHVRPLPDHPTNGDEERFPSKIASFSKGLPHNALGEPDVAAYDALVAALSSGEPDAFESVPLGAPDPATQRRMVNPQSALAFDLEGADSHHLAMRPPPQFSSAEEAAEIAENYWMALLRDVPITAYDTHPLAAAAAADLSRFADFRGPRHNGLVTPATLFRGGEPGTLLGPHISQFLYGSVPFGAQNIDSRVLVAAPGVDYLTAFSAWLAVQNGVTPAPQQFLDARRYITTGRDLATYVHIDALYQAYFCATLVLLGRGAQWADSPYGPTPDGGAGRPSAVPSRTQVGFGTFGGPHILSLVTEVATRALKAVWYQKWSVHRRLRPEEFAGRVEVVRVNPGRYPIHRALFESSVLPRVFHHNAARNGGQGSWLLPMAFPEGSPIHPSYGAGHATVAGACVTILKAWFDERQVMTNPVVPTTDGSTLLPYTGDDAQQLTIGGELNKVAANISLGRDAAGVHWRSDHRESLRLGEQVAISILRDQRGTYNETRGTFPGGGFDGFTLTTFDGQTIKV